MYHKIKSEYVFPTQNLDQPERTVEHLIYKKLL